MKKKRNKKVIRKRQELILRAADNLQKSTGIDYSNRVMFVGGAKPKSVRKAQEERKTN